MVVYVKLRMKAKTERELALTVLVNDGAHSERLVLVVYEKIAKELGLEKGSILYQWLILQKLLM